jgi:hypothetical protein
MNIDEIKSILLIQSGAATSVASALLGVVDNINRIVWKPDGVTLGALANLVAGVDEVKEDADTLYCRLSNLLEDLKKGPEPIPPTQTNPHWLPDAHLCYRVSRWCKDGKKWIALHGGTARAFFRGDIVKHPDDTLMLTITDDSYGGSGFNPKAHLVWHPVSAQFTVHAGSEFPAGHFATLGYDVVKMREYVLTTLGRTDPGVPVIEEDKA